MSLADVSSPDPPPSPTAPAVSAAHSETAPSLLMLVVVPIAGSLAATAVRYALDPWLGALFPFVTYYLAMVFCAWYGGAVPGFLALLVGLLFGAYFYLSPADSIFSD